MKLGKGIAIGLAVLALGYFINDYSHQKNENKRNASNYENAQKERDNAIRAKDSTINKKNLDIVAYEFRKTKELKAYLDASNNQIRGLRAQLKENSIRLKQVSKIVSSVYEYRDTTEVVFNYDSLAQKIASNQSFVVPFKKVSPCITTTGTHIFENGKFDFKITEQTFQDTVNVTKYWYRKKHRWVFGIKTGFLRKKKWETKTFSKCVDPSTIIIDIGKKVN